MAGPVGGGAGIVEKIKIYKESGFKKIYKNVL